MKQRIEKLFILIVSWLSRSNEQYCGKVYLSVSSFCQDSFQMYLLKYLANTVKYTHVSLCRCPAFPLSATSRVQWRN